MTPEARRGAADAPAAGYIVTCLALLWLSGVSLRLTVLAVPPIIPMMHADLHLSEAAIGVLSSLPPLLFAFAAVPGSLFIARFGASAILIAGLVLTAIGSALRGALPDIAVIDAATIVMAFGVSIMQPSLPPLVTEWLPRRVGFATAVYTNGLLVGEILVVALTIPFVLPLLGGSWRLSFVAWSVPVLATAILVALFAPRSNIAEAKARGGAARGWPDWRNPAIWQLGLMLGGANAAYFTCNAFLPDYLTQIGRPDLVSVALSSLNLAQLPASFLMLAFAERVVLRIWPFVAVGVMLLAGVFGLSLMPASWSVFWSGLIGFAAAIGLIITLALPPLLSRARDVPRMSAAMFTISYSCAVIVPIVDGVAWDTIGSPYVAFVPIGLCGLMVGAIALSADLRGHARALAAHDA